LLSFLNAELNRKTGNKNEPDFFFYRNVMNWALIFIIQEALIPRGEEFICIPAITLTLTGVSDCSLMPTCSFSAISWPEQVNFQ
jgi:hypothetical protein